MKRMTILITFLSVLQTPVHSQCAVNYQEILNNHCKGLYLTHKEISNRTKNELSLVLKKNLNYTIYLLNPSVPISEVKLTGSINDTVLNLETRYYPDKKFAVCNLSPTNTEPHVLSINFHSDPTTYVELAEKKCLLLALYLQDSKDLNPGFYMNFDELKYNNPSVNFDFPIKEVNRCSGKNQVTHYKIDASRRQLKAVGSIVGFSDGKNLFINSSSKAVKPTSEFIKADQMAKYYYLEFIEYVPMVAGSVVTVVPNFIQILMDINTGSTIKLNNKRIREIISNDEVLLDEFNNDKNKSTLYKEYLTRYMDRNFDY